MKTTESFLNHRVMKSLFIIKTCFLHSFQVMCVILHFPYAGCSQIYTHFLCQISSGFVLQQVGFSRGSKFNLHPGITWIFNDQSEHTLAMPLLPRFFMTLLVLRMVLPFDVEAGWFSPLAACFTRLGGRTEAAEQPWEVTSLEELGMEGASIPTLIMHAWQCGLRPNMELVYISNFTVIKRVNGSRSTRVQ